MLRKTLAVIGAFCGVSGAFAFSPINKEEFHNWKAAAMSALSAVVALFNFWQHRRRHIAFKQQKLVTPYKSELRMTGIFFTMVCLAGFGAFLVVGLFNKDKLTARSIYIPAVWSALGLKWAIALLHYINVYEETDVEMAKKFPPLLKDPLLAADVTDNTTA